MYWVKEVNLAQADQNELVSGKKLTDKHINGCCHILSQQFPDMPPPIQSTLLSQTLASLRRAQSKEIFFITSVTTGLFPTFHKREFYIMTPWPQKRSTQI
jgi:hypothetical protein